VTALTGVLLEGLSAADAVAAPRLVATERDVFLEPGFGPEVIAALHQEADRVLVWPAPAPYFGGVAMIAADGPAADPRRGGRAFTLG
jgi:hypothetical protein